MRCRPPLAWTAPLLAALALSSAASCGTTDVAVFTLAAGGADAAGASGASGAAGGPDATAASPPTSLGTLQDFCAGSGPPVFVESATDGGVVTTCPDALAQHAFRDALCTCDDYVGSQALVTDAFDGSKGPYDPTTPLAGGSVGVNGDLHPTGPLQIGGSLWASTSATITTAAVVVEGDLHAEGEVRPTSLVVKGDAWLAGGLQTTGDVTVNGTLHVPAMQPLDVGGMRNYGAPVDASFQVASACDCAPADLVDVAGVVATYAAHNDDVALAIDPTGLANVQSDTAMTLGCGRIFFTQIAAGQASIHLTVQGARAAIFVAGDLSTSDFIVDVPTGTELDLFVAGNVTVRGVFRVGSVANPARARTYVGGSSVGFESAATLAGNLYAPSATLTLGASAATTLYGSIFASKVSASADLTIHFDEAILTPSTTPACSAP